MSWFRGVLPILLGAAGGYAYYYFVGCVSGSCPITSNPWSSTAYGALIGAVFVRRSAFGTKDTISRKKRA